MEKTNNRGVSIHYGAIQFLYWAIIAVFMVYIVPLLRQRGFDNGQIGILLSVRAFACITLQPVAAAFADRHSETIPLKYVLAVIVVASIVTTGLFAKIRFGFWGSFVIFAFLGASVNALSPLYNSLGMQYVLAGYGLNFSAARGCGSISYALSCIALGALVDRFGAESTLTLQFAMLVLSLVILLTFKTCKVPEVMAKQRVKPHSTWSLMRDNRAYALFLGASLLLFVGTNMSTCFLVDVVEKLGGVSRDLGYAQFVLAASEFPMALYFMRLKGRIGTDNIMRICAVFICVKILGILLSPNIPALLAVQAFQMLGSGLYWSGSVYYVAENIPPEDQIKGQALAGAFSTGLGGGIGSVVSGWVSNRWGIDALLLSGAVCAMAGVAVMFAAMRDTQKQTAPSPVGAPGKSAV